MLLFEAFVVYGKHLVRTYYIENGLYYMVLRDLKSGVAVWRGEVPRLQYLREFCERWSKVAILDNGDKTSS